MEYTKEQIENILSVYRSMDEFYAMEAQKYLTSTDYITNKIAEYQYIGKELDKDYTEILNKREEAREVIRKYREK